MQAGRHSSRRCGRQPLAGWAPVCRLCMGRLLQVPSGWFGQQQQQQEEEGTEQEQEKRLLGRLRQQQQPQQEEEEEGEGQRQENCCQR